MSITGGSGAGSLVVVVAWLTQELGGVHSTTLPASGWLLLLDLHPVWLVVLITLASATNVTVANVGRNEVWVLHGALTFENGVFHVEHVNTLHLTQQLESLQTSGLVQVSGDGTWGGTWTNQRRVWAGDLRQGGGGFGLNLGGLSHDSGGGQKSGLSGSTNKSVRKPGG